MSKPERNRECGDNLHLDIRAKTRENFNLAIQIAVSFQFQVRSYAIDPKKGLVLLWIGKDSDSSKATDYPFPVPLDAKAAADMAWAWLQEEWEKDPKVRVACDPDAPAYGDGDVISERGFRVYNETWGKVAGHEYALCAIQPAYIWLGK